MLGVVKRNPLFLHEIEWKNNGFLFTTPNIFNIFLQWNSILFVNNTKHSNVMKTYRIFNSFYYMSNKYYQ